MSKIKRRKDVKNEPRPPRGAYEMDFKRMVAKFALQNSTKAACIRFDVSQTNVRRWKKIALESQALQMQRQVVLPPKTIAVKRKRTRRCVEEQDNFNDLESMPLNKRILPKSPVPPVLQSQPLSPTKLKVTRQAPAKLPLILPKPFQQVPPEEKKVSLRWTNHYTNIQDTYSSLLNTEQYADVTLIAEDQAIKCHRMVLSTSSPYFENILRNIHPYQHPVIILKDIPYQMMKCLCGFMYAGEIKVNQEKLSELISIAETLKIKGLVNCKRNEPEPKPEEKREIVPANLPISVNPVDKSIRLPPRDRSDRALRNELRSQRVEHKPVKVENKTPKIENEVPKIDSKITRSSNKSQKVENRSHKSLRVERIPKVTEKIEAPKDIDPLGLLKPVYEEAAPADLTPQVSKDRITYKKPSSSSLSKRLKRRKLMESDHEESPPPVFYSRKGTRSRPNVKVPKYYNTDYDKPNEKDDGEMSEGMVDPLLSAEEIKTEPIDVEDNEIVFHDEEMLIGIPQPNTMDPVIVPVLDTASLPLPLSESIPKLLDSFESTNNFASTDFDTAQNQPVDPLADVSVPEKEPDAMQQNQFIIESVITVDEDKEMESEVSEIAFPETSGSIEANSLLANKENSKINRDEEQEIDEIIDDGEDPKTRNVENDKQEQSLSCGLINSNDINESQEENDKLIKKSSVNEELSSVKEPNLTLNTDQLVNDEEPDSTCLESNNDLNNLVEPVSTCTEGNINENQAILEIQDQISVNEPVLISTLEKNQASDPLTELTEDNETSSNEIINDKIEEPRLQVRNIENLKNFMTKDAFISETLDKSADVEDQVYVKELSISESGSKDDAFENCDSVNIRESCARSHKVPEGTEEVISDF